MKTNIVGWIYIIASTLVFVAGTLFLITSLIIPSTGIDSTNQLIIDQLITGIITFLLGIFGLIFGSALRRHKKWSWYAGMVLVPLATGGNMFNLIAQFNVFFLIPLAINIFCLYALISEKKLFLP